METKVNKVAKIVTLFAFVLFLLPSAHQGVGLVAVQTQEKLRSEFHYALSFWLADFLKFKYSWHTTLY